jgi:hypothetical protein
MVSPIVTFIGAILSMVAISLLPGRTAIKKGETERFDTWGKLAIFSLALVLLVVGGYALVSWYTSKERDLFTMGNVVLFAVLGFGLIANNFWLTRRIKMVQEQVHEVEVLGEEKVKGPGTGGAVTAKGPSAKAPQKKVKRPVTPGAPGIQATGPSKPVAIKKVKADKPTVAPKPANAGPEELIEASSGPEKCPSCDTPLEHTHDGACPVCGEKIPR